MNISQDRQVPLVAYKLKEGVGAWWNRYQEEHRLRGEPCIRYWDQFKALMKARFLPADYEQILFIEFQNCSQGNRSVLEYTGEFLRLQVRYNLAETKDQPVARYTNGLNKVIRDQLVMQQMWSIEQAQALALKVERRENQVSFTFSHGGHIKKAILAGWKVKQLNPRQNNLSLNKLQRRVSQGEIQMLLYAKCGEGHVSSNCLRRKVANTTRYEDDGDSDGSDDGEYENEREEEHDVCEKEGDEVVCVIHRLLSSTPQFDYSQRKKILESLTYGCKKG